MLRKVLPKVVLRVLLAVVLLVVGAAGALAAILVHDRWWGLVLGLAAVTCTAWALPAGTLRFVFILGWLAALGHALTPRTGGGFLISANVGGYGLLGGSTVVFLVVLATLPAPGARRRPGDDDPRVLEG